MADLPMEREVTTLSHPRRVRLDLTPAETRAVFHALSNLTEAADYREQLDFFGSAAGADAAWRAHRKLSEGMALLG